MTSFIRTVSTPRPRGGFPRERPRRHAKLTRRNLPAPTTMPAHDAPDSRTQPERLDALLGAARAGNGRASCRLGDLHREGDGVAQDLDEAFRWYSLGASQGDAHAQNNLASMFFGGVGCTADEERAVFWYRKSAEQGHSTAQANLARRYLRGEGVAPDMTEAFRWFHAAAAQGDLASTCALGTMYQYGRSVKRNIVAAGQLHLLAAKGGIVAAEVALSDYLEELQDIALSGNQTASRLLCEMHNLGLGVAESGPLTWTWIKWAKAHCTPADDLGEAAEVEEAHDFYGQWLDDEARADGERVLAALLRPFPAMARAKVPPLVRFKRRGRSGSGGTKASA